MSRKLTISSTVSVAATLLFTIISTGGSGALAEARNPELMPAPAPAVEVVTFQPSLTVSAPEAPAEETPSTLAALVAQQDDDAALTPELKCLAGAIYFESKSEPFAGQLAVGRVVVNRSKSGRFPASYCGVVYQPSQFSFVRGRAMPAIRTASQDWKDAVAIARIADADSWDSSVEGALFFHAARVSPGWNRTRVARLGNHVFYR